MNFTGATRKTSNGPVKCDCFEEIVQARLPFAGGFATLHRVAPAAIHPVWWQQTSHGTE
eukprot:CAMPEP_0206543920 /NCGR_PEP_ID=MMETSP0325_2-20121206/11190_1 /ASSEMBLY_ACC=CAM_ASM_000347 /TAXON_ID=2866 /ORGANISM="Crypthecodinium cohnii, Strain Seligo" /LENGTH=58 /DNA_ID=CAMNT_0054042531 /DNA_START=108 /DNA_END=281 /DNA_ORIENTATION=+